MRYPRSSTRRKKSSSENEDENYEQVSEFVEKAHARNLAVKFDLHRPSVDYRVLNCIFLRRMLIVCVLCSVLFLGFGISKAEALNKDTKEISLLASFTVLVMILIIFGKSS